MSLHTTIPAQAVWLERCNDPVSNLIGRTRAKQVGQLIHADVCGPMQVTTPGGSRFFTMFTDDFS